MEFKTILNDEMAEIVEKKSKFIANLCYVKDVEQAEAKIKEIKKKYYDAKHNCIAYRVIENGQIIEKSSDDGEPSGTAGAPMLNILQKNNISNVVIVVTRYFGGILLGTGGLVRAYSEAMQKALERSTLIYRVEGVKIKITLDYSNFDTFKYYCKNNEIKITNIEYSNDIILEIEVEKNRKNFFEDDIKNKNVIIKQYQVLEKIFINKNINKNK